MGRQYPQTEEARVNLSNPTFTYINALRANKGTDYVFVKDELVAFTGFSERSVRNQIAEIANYYPIIATSDRKGYQMLSFTEFDTDEAIEEMVNKADHQLAELQSRIDALKARMKPLIAFKVKATEELDSRSTKL